MIQGTANKPSVSKSDHNEVSDAETGFTIIELLLAMAVFSFVLMITVAGFVQINRSYTKGVTVRRAQDAAREIVEEIASQIRVTPSGDITFDNANRMLCIGRTRYDWSLANNGGSNVILSVGGQEIRFVRTQDVTNCTSSTISIADDYTELLVPHTMPLEFSISPIGTTGTFSIVLKVVAENDDKIITQNTDFSSGCSTNLNDNAFCHKVEYRTTVKAL